jgi:hypothetical protein
MTMPDYAEDSANQMGCVCVPIDHRLYSLIFLTAV